MANKVLVVCTGNICRSPYGEVRLRSLNPELIVASAGLATKVSKLQGKPADKIASRVASDFFDIDMSSHKAQQLTQQLVDDYDVILVMEPEQLEELTEHYIEADHKTFLFSHWSGGGAIVDPYMQGVHVFRAVYSDMDKAAEAWVSKLI